METKLTLSLDKTVIEKVRKYAKSKQTSLSQIVENYFYYLTIEEKKNQGKKEKTPICLPQNDQ